MRADDVRLHHKGPGVGAAGWRTIRTYIAGLGEPCGVSGALGKGAATRPFNQGERFARQFRQAGILRIQTVDELFQCPGVLLQDGRSLSVRAGGDRLAQPDGDAFECLHSHYQSVLLINVGDGVVSALNGLIVTA